MTPREEEEARARVEVAIYELMIWPMIGLLVGVVVILLIFT